MNIALVLSGGSGTRLNSRIPKQYIQIGSKPIIAYCLESLENHKDIDAIQVAAAVEWHKDILQWMDGEKAAKKFKGFSAPGKNRQMSICQALEDIKGYATENDCVLIHDAARPILSRQMISACLDAVKEGHDGAVPVLPMKDTVYSSVDGKAISGLLKRNEIYAGQAPEAFKFGAYYKANQLLLPDRILEINGSTEPAVMAGLDVAMIPGDERNFKITTQADLNRFRKMIEKI